MCIIKAALPADGAIDPDNQLALVGQMVGSSSRGPSNYYQAIKPEIGAPGASVSAIAGTGTGTGTGSGAGQTGAQTDRARSPSGPDPL